MFLLTLSPSSVTSDVPDLTGKHFRCADMRGFLGAGGALSDRVSLTPPADGTSWSSSDQIEVTEGLPSKPGSPRALLLRATVHPATMTVTLHRVENSGRPLYYYFGPDGTFAAASHLRLLKHAGIKFEENSTRLAELLMYRMLMCPQTLVHGVQQLRAGETIELSYKNDGPGKAPGWSARTTAIFNPPRAEEGFDEAKLVRDSQAFLEGAFLELNCEPERFGSLLSGGLDSTLLTKMANRLLGVNESFSCSYPFEDPRDDIEQRYAETAAENIGTRHHVYVPTMAQYLHGIIDSVYHCEQPMMHLQTVLLHLVYKHEFAPRGINIIANGEGADGIFGLKTHRFIEYLRDHSAYRAMLNIAPVRSAVQLVATLTNRFGLIARMAGTKLEPGTPLTDPRHIIWSDAVFGYWPWVRRYTGATREDVISGRASGLAEYQDRELLEQVSITAFIGEGTQTQLVWSTAADASGIGLFYPFPNAKLVDAAYRAPWSYKLGEPKKALRDVCRNLGVAEYIITRPKAAFGIRSERYGPRGSVLEPIIGVAAKAVDEPTLRSLQSPEIYKAQTLWTMINLAIWRRLFINNEPLHQLHDELDAEMRRLGVLQTFNNVGRVAPMIS